MALQFCHILKRVEKGFESVSGYNGNDPEPDISGPALQDKNPSYEGPEPIDFPEEVLKTKK